MTNIMTFKSEYGPISVEMDDATARSASDESNKGDAGDWVKKGVKSLSSRDNEVHIESDAQFNDAISSLRAYASTLLDVVHDIKLTPSEVAVEVGLKLTGSAGFIIAKAEGEAEMKVSLKWEPAKTAQAGKPAKAKNASK